MQLEHDSMERQCPVGELYILDLFAKSNGEDRFEAHRYPIVVLNFCGLPVLNIQDPALVSELYTTKNHLVDKDGDLRDWTIDLMG